MNAVRELATQVKKLKKGREADSEFTPFVAVDLAKFLPDDFADFKPVRLDGSPEMAKLFGGPVKGRRMTLANWLLAWRRLVVRAQLSHCSNPWSMQVCLGSCCCGSHVV